jgi:hypothetical protein
MTSYTSYTSAKSGNWEAYTITYSAETTNTWKVRQSCLHSSRAYMLI